MKNKRLIRRYAIVIGAAIWFVQQPARSSTTDFLRTSQVVPGEVVRLNSDSQHPQVEFTTLEGQRISVVAQSRSPVSVGEKVEMRYDPKQPHIAKINTLWDVWGAHLFQAWPFMGLLVAEMRGLSARWGASEESD
ncbi:DUF3592 domain-containing protein [Caballeronia sp. SL2Y3]|uniref:DUF3592 domain-containing protein n=1 Tax=Caballeronia sp. SL2Y3 TaxID=2878151 RepID=UPI001FD52559|nr:DUF3592 domain-containing protein [Caballeronia sp. SL2Y3]